MGAGGVARGLQKLVLLRQLLPDRFVLLEVSGQECPLHIISFLSCRYFRSIQSVSDRVQDFLSLVEYRNLGSHFEVTIMDCEQNRFEGEDAG